MGFLSRRILLVFISGSLLMTLQAPVSAVLATDEDDDRCAIVSETDYKGDDAHADLYFSDVTVKDGDLYINGTPYAEVVEKQLIRLMKDVEGGSQWVPTDPGNNQPPQNQLNQLNPMLNPVMNSIIEGILGPILDTIDGWDMHNLPTVHVEFLIPSEVDDLDGKRVAVIVNTEICVSEL